MPLKKIKYGPYCQPIPEHIAKMIFDPSAFLLAWRKRRLFPLTPANKHTSSHTSSTDVSASAQKTSVLPPTERFLQQEPSQHHGLIPTHRAPAPIRLAQNYRVLIVEDDADNLFYAECAVEDMGYQWASTALGNMALPLALAYNPDLILLDIRLKETTGFDVLRQLQQHVQTAHIPTIAVTALSAPRDMAQISKAGFTDCLLKPYLLEEIAQTLAAYLPQTANNLQT